MIYLLFRSLLGPKGMFGILLLLVNMNGLC